MRLSKYRVNEGKKPHFFPVKYTFDGMQMVVWTCVSGTRHASGNTPIEAYHSYIRSLIRDAFTNG